MCIYLVDPTSHIGLIIFSMLKMKKNDAKASKNCTYSDSTRKNSILDLTTNQSNTILDQVVSESLKFFAHFSRCCVMACLRNEWTICYIGQGVYMDKISSMI